MIVLKNILQRLHLYDNGELGNLSLTGFNVEISRHYSKYLIVYYLPTALFVVVSWTSFIIPPQVVAGRMGLLITILLCLVNIFNVVNNNSPSVKVGISLHDVDSLSVIPSFIHETICPRVHLTFRKGFIINPS